MTGQLIHSWKKLQSVKPTQAPKRVFDDKKAFHISDKAPTKYPYFSRYMRFNKILWAGCFLFTKPLFLSSCNFIHTFKFSLN